MQKKFDLKKNEVWVLIFELVASMQNNFFLVLMMKQNFFSFSFERQFSEIVLPHQRWHEKKLWRKNCVPLTLNKLRSFVSSMIRVSSERYFFSFFFKISVCCNWRNLHVSCPSVCPKDIYDRGSEHRRSLCQQYFSNYLPISYHFN